MTGMPIPPSWGEFKPSESLSLHRVATLARRGEKNLRDELNALLETAEHPHLQPESRTEDGATALGLACSGWEDTIRDTEALWGQTSQRYRNHQLPVARFPLPNQGKWDGSGLAAPWELPAAALIARGADPFAPSKKVMPWRAAWDNGWPALVLLMLRCPTRPSWEKLAEPGLGVPLLHAAVQRHEALAFRMTDALLQGGFPVDHRNSWGKTALMEARDTNGLKTQVVHQLLDAGADPLARDNSGVCVAEEWCRGDSAVSFEEKKAWRRSVLSRAADGASQQEAVLQAATVGWLPLVPRAWRQAQTAEERQRARHYALLHSLACTHEAPLKGLSEEGWWEEANDAERGARDLIAWTGATPYAGKASPMWSTEPINGEHWVQALELLAPAAGRSNYKWTMALIHWLAPATHNAALRRALWPHLGNACLDLIANNPTPRDPLHLLMTQLTQWLPADPEEAQRQVVAEGCGDPVTVAHLLQVWAAVGGRRLEEAPAAARDALLAQPGWSHAEPGQALQRAIAQEERNPGIQFVPEEWVGLRAAVLADRLPAAGPAKRHRF